MLYPVYVHIGDAKTAHGMSLPDFPGCFSAADNWHDIPQKVQEAVECHMAGEELPIPSDEEAIKYLQEENNQTNVFPLFGLAAITGNNDRLWSAVTNAPIPANGLYLLPFVKTFTTSAQAGVENTIRKAWANGWTLQETIA